MAYGTDKNYTVCHHDLIIAGTAKTWHSSFLVEYYSDTVFEHIVNMGYKAVHTERYKYIKYNKLQGMDELYDLKLDPFELSNLIAHPQGQGLCS